MKSINWAEKLTSRKFWVALVGLISGILLAFRADEKTIENVTGIIMAGASVLAYCIGEGLADAAGAKGDHEYLTGYDNGYTAGTANERKKEPPDTEEDDLK